MSLLFIYYPKCGTCRKALKWLKENGIDVKKRHIAETPPTRKELEEWFIASQLPIRKLFNTSGKKYREQGLKEKVKTAPETELLDILATDGMLVKRPILVIENRTVFFGFNESNWKTALTEN
ncbi:MAG: arsenate reductase family protein [Acidobacteria bacterium]|nr:arsenate reductase family protein [Acidobacteriota bacterium]